MKIYKFVVQDIRRDDIVGYGKTAEEAEDQARRLWVILNEPLDKNGYGHDTWEEAKDYYGAYDATVSIPSVWHCDEVTQDELNQAEEK